MLGTYFTFPELLLWIPLLAGVISFFIKKEQTVKAWALGASLLTLCVSIIGICYSDAAKYPSYNQVSYYWLKYLGNSFHLGLDGTGHLLSLLTAIAYPIIFISSYNRKWQNAKSYFGLMLLTQAGIMGVFSAMDALLFYFFWELALIPVYFLCSIWGGKLKIATTFKFFVYTFTGSLLMLLGIIYIYLHTSPRIFEDGYMAAHSFGLNAIQNASLSPTEQGWLFWIFFAAFAVKIPIWPLHTWQPDTYDQADTPIVMVLSGLMVKMGLFGIIRWMIPVFPDALNRFGDIAILLSVIGIVYASCLAIVQDNLKKLVAYSSIAHLGLMAATLFSKNELGIQGVMVQMFNHGVNVIGLWIIIDILIKKSGVRNISELGGVALKAPVLTIMMVVIGLANIGLPLTNGFVGEFMMYGGLFQYSYIFAAISIVAIILAAVYILGMIRKVFYGELSPAAANMTDISFSEKISLGFIVIVIFVTGVYPQPIIDLTKGAVALLTQ